MRFRGFLIFVFFALVLAVNTVAQDVTNHEETATNLRLKLMDIQVTEVELQLRLQQLDEAIKPENIEHALAGIGSTRPEDLREQRRRLLTIERDSVVARLRLLNQSRSRLESAIANAEVLAYQQSAEPPVAADQSKTAKPSVGSNWLSPAVPACQGTANRSTKPDLN
jgi:hypothetical protein